MHNVFPKDKRKNPTQYLQIGLTGLLSQPPSDMYVVPLLGRPGELCWHNVEHNGSHINVSTIEHNESV